MAAANIFEATVRGKGGHGGMPHLARDPVIAAAAIVQALSPLVAHETDPTDSAVLGVTRLSTGLHTWMSQIICIKVTELMG